MNKNEEKKESDYPDTQSEFNSGKWAVGLRPLSSTLDCLSLLYFITLLLYESHTILHPTNIEYWCALHFISVYNVQPPALASVTS